MCDWAPGSEVVKVPEHKFREAGEVPKLLQLDCGKHETILAETERTLQKLQRSAGHEEKKWKIKVDVSQKTSKQVQMSLTFSEQKLTWLRRENSSVHQ